MNHQEALRLVHKLTPQVKDYDKFMHVGAKWLPYTMYFHETNFVSETINTDKLGFRYSYHNSKKYSVSDLPKDKVVNLIIGGSTALGVGSSSDKTTLASYLSNISGQVWLNFSGRGYNAAQELILLLMHKHKFSKINKIVVLSGMNTLALEGIPDHLASDNGRYYYSYEFNHYMNLYNEDMKRQKNSFSSKSNNNFLNRFFRFLSYENPADKIITDEQTSLEERVDRAASETAKYLNNMRLLLADHDSEIYFFLQPLAYWTKKHLTNNEKKVFDAVDTSPNNFYRLFSKVLGQEVHLPYFQSIVNKCNENISVYDMNVLLSSHDKISETLFIDRVHFNDLGNRLLAEIIYNNITGGKNDD